MPNHLPLPFSNTDGHGNSTHFSDSDLSEILDEKANKAMERLNNSAFGRWHQRNDIGLGVAAAVSCLLVPLPISIGLGVAAQLAANSLGFGGQDADNN